MRKREGRQSRPIFHFAHNDGNKPNRYDPGRRKEKGVTSAGLNFRRRVGERQTPITGVCRAKGKGGAEASI